MLCMWWLELSVNGKDERGVIRNEYMHTVVVCNSEQTNCERMCCGH